MIYAPILLFTFNRPIHTQETVTALSKCPEAKYSDLIIFSDGPRQNKPNDYDLVDETRKFLKSIQGFKSVKVIEQKTNQGLANSIISGVSTAISQHGKAIILEDDLVVSSNFLAYMNFYLNAYQNDERVISIHGYCYPTKSKLPEVFFIRGADCWGWATWARGWNLFIDNSTILKSNLQSKNLVDAFNYWNSFDYFGMLQNQIDGKIDSWAIRWYASAFLCNKLTLYPGVSLVQNIGFDNSGAHCKTENRFDVDLKDKKHNFKKININENIPAKIQFANFFRSLNSKPFLSFKEKFLIYLKVFFQR